MDPAICPGPFDVIVERRTLQLFPSGERGAAVARLSDAWRQTASSSLTITTAHGSHHNRERI